MYFNFFNVFECHKSFSVLAVIYFLLSTLDTYSLYLPILPCQCIYVYTYDVYSHSSLKKVKYLAARKKNTVNDLATSTTSLLQVCGCCDNW